MILIGLQLRRWVTKKLTVTPELASYRHKRREKRAQQKRNLDAAEALVTLQKNKSVHRELLPSTSETTEIEDQALSDSESIQI